MPRRALLVLVAALAVGASGCAPTVVVPRSVPVADRGGVRVEGPFTAADAEAIVRTVRATDRTDAPVHWTYDVLPLDRIVRIGPMDYARQAYRWRQRPSLPPDEAEVEIEHARFGRLADDPAEMSWLRLLRDETGVWRVIPQRTTIGTLFVEQPPGLPIPARWSETPPPTPGATPDFGQRLAFRWGR